MTIYNLSELAKNAGITMQEARLAVVLSRTDISYTVLAEDPPITDSYVGEVSMAIAEYVAEKTSLQKEVEKLQARNAELEALVDKLVKR